MIVCDWSAVTYFMKVTIFDEKKEGLYWLKNYAIYKLWKTYDVGEWYLVCSTNNQNKAKYSK